MCGRRQELQELWLKEVTGSTVEGGAKFTTSEQIPFPEALEKASKEQSMDKPDEVEFKLDTRCTHTHTLLLRKQSNPLSLQ